eukprot:scaffold184702_cov40-Prasinocladus_malaysianus.AAC.1
MIHCNQNSSAGRWGLTGRAGTPGKHRRNSGLSGPVCHGDALHFVMHDAWSSAIHLIGRDAEAGDATAIDVRVLIRVGASL